MDISLKPFGNSLACRPVWIRRVKFSSTRSRLIDLALRQININARPTGYTSLDLSYIDNNNIIIALKDNDITLPSDRGFPFQVVAMGKYGYKWAKWVTRIELSSNTNFRGYWESNGYNNNGDVNGPEFETGQ